MTTVYLDLDGVFADFDYGVYRACGQLPSQLEANAMWSVVSKVPGFYRNLPKTEYAARLYWAISKMAFHYKADVKVLTALPRTSTYPTAREEKQQWVYENLGKLEVLSTVGSANKWKYATLGGILIDDKPDNINDWLDKPDFLTKAVLHDPAHWNKTITYLQELL